MSQTKIEKFLFIEEGSVDVDSLEPELAVTNTEIKIVIYRQGSAPPHLVYMEKSEQLKLEETK